MLCIEIKTNSRASSEWAQCITQAHKYKMELESTPSGLGDSYRGPEHHNWDYHKPAETDTVIHNTSNHPIEYKEAAFTYIISRMKQIQITLETKQKEWRRTGTVSHSKNCVVKNMKLVTSNSNSSSNKDRNDRKWVKFTYVNKRIKILPNVLENQFKNNPHVNNNLFQNLSANKKLETSSSIVLYTQWILTLVIKCM